MSDLPLPPGPKKKFLGDRLLSLQRDPLRYAQRLQTKYGDVVHFMIGTQHVVMLNHPDLIHDVLATHNRNFTKGYTLQQAKRIVGEGLLTSEGEYHLNHRRLMQPIFHRQQIGNFAPVMVEFAMRTAARWQEGTTFNIGRQMEGLTLAIATKTLLGADIEAEAPELGQAVNELMDLFNPLMLLMADILIKLPVPPRQRLYRSTARMDKTIYRLIAEHRTSGAGDDLLALMLRAQEGEADAVRMTDAQLRDEVFIIMLAGYETLANTMTWLWYLLTTHPEVEAEFHAELDRVLQGRTPTLADVDKLTYTRQVLSEGLRLYPPVWFLDRRALADYTVAGYHVPAGSLLLMSQWLMHRDPRFYSDPTRFNPHRWTPEMQDALPRYAYFPFGGGPRVCIGEQFAWMEGILLLATIGQRWRVRVQSPEDVRIAPGMNLRPKKGMMAQVQAREGLNYSDSSRLAL